MKREVELNLIQRCLAHHQQNTTTNGEQGTIDTQRYISNERFGIEKEKILSKMPTPVVHWSEIRDPNSFVKRKTTLGELVFTRDSDGAVHAFHNSCRHRGARLVEQGEGCAKRFTCPYHAWTYGTDGELLSVPSESQCFPGLDKSQLGLNEIPSVEKYGFVWLCPTAKTLDEAETLLDEFLGKEMIDDLRWLAVDKLFTSKSIKKVWKANWKILSEGGMETYHFSVAHARSLAPYFLKNTAVIDQLGRNFRVVMPNKKLEHVAGLPESEQFIKGCTHIVFSCFPACAMLMQSEHIEWITFRALSAGETEISIVSLVHDDPRTISAERDALWQKNMEITDRILDEDFEIGEQIQQSCESGAINQLQYGANEWALKAFNDILDSYCDKK